VGECGETTATKKNGTKKTMEVGVNPSAGIWHVKATIAKEVVLAHPDYTKPFEIYTDASTMQLGAVITQGNRPIGFCWGRVKVLARVQTDDGWTKDWFSQILQSIERSCDH
jgi:hypothetical protein